METPINLVKLSILKVSDSSGFETLSGNILTYLIKKI